MVSRARTVTPADGATHLFPVSFPLSPVQGRAGVNVYVHPASAPHPGAAISTSAFTWISDGQISITAAPAAGNVVDIRRATLDTGLDNVVQAGGSLRAQDLVQNDTQLLYLTQEREDMDDDLQGQMDVEVAARVTAVANEATLRGNADTTLSNSIIAEAGARVAQDGVLNTAITNEATTRANADASLQNQVNALHVPATFIVNGTPYTDPATYPLPMVTPEQFAGSKASGVVGDGTDDGPCLAAASAAINATGGGALFLYPGRTYWVGSQTQGGAAPPQGGGGIYTWAPNTGNPIDINGCTRPVVVMGNGARIKCLPGQRYGAFNPDGSARADTPPYFGAGIPGFSLSSPYASMIWVRNNTGPVAVLDVELDGNILNQLIGGPYGNTGRQIACGGISLTNNTAAVYVRNIHSHDHGEDGGQGSGPGVLNTREQVLIEACKFTNNGRQGFSLVGGNGWQFVKCKFNQTGKNIGFSYSGPGAGVDLEAEAGKWVTNVLFEHCDFEDNSGVGLLSDVSSHIKNVLFRYCRFIGTTTWALWPKNPRMRFDDCTIVGSWVHAKADPDPDVASKFRRCLITNDVTLSPTGAVYGGGTGYNLFDNGGGSQNIRFEECKVQQTLATVATCIMGNNPSGIDDINALQFHNCSAEKVGVTELRLDGIFSGDRTTFLNCIGFPDPNALPGGKVSAGYSLSSFIFDGVRYRASMDPTNGKRLYRGTKTWDPPSIAASASATTTVTATGCVVGDRVVDFSLGVDLQGLVMTAYVSAANTVTIVLFNPTGGAVDLASSTLTVKVAEL